MTHLRTPPTSPLYAEHAERLGYVPNYARVFALAPEAYAAWLALGAAVRSGLDERRYELVTLVAARTLASAYCTLAHAAALRDRFYDEAALRAILADHHHAGLSPADVAAMDFAELIAADPAAATAGDLAALREHGLSDADIMRIVLTVAARRFFTAVLAATGARPDPVYDRLAEVVAAAPRR